jgi:DNA-directed RNA polymerase specialized sigma24 family protein
MFGAARPHTVAPMIAEAPRAELSGDLRHLYGAAVAASRDHTTAVEIAERVLLTAAPEGVGDDRSLTRRQLVERAIRLGVRMAPAEGFAAMEADDREAIALARLAGYSVAEIATTLETSVDDVKARMRRGLQSAAQALAGRCPGPAGASREAVGCR